MTAMLGVLRESLTGDDVRAAMAAAAGKRNQCAFLLQYVDEDAEWYGYMGSGWCAALPDVIHAAWEADLLGEHRIGYWPISDGDGTVDGALITLDLPGEHRRSTFALEWKDLTDDWEAMGWDAAAAVVRMVRYHLACLQGPPPDAMGYPS